MTLNRNDTGITFIELLVVVLIIAVLAAIAVPTYTSYLQRGRRADAKTALEQLRAAQEVFRAENGAYTNNFALLNANWGGPPAKVGLYDITLVATATTFTGTATPTGSQASDGPLTIDQNGVKSPADKWAK